MNKIRRRGTYENLTAQDAEYVCEIFEADVKFEEVGDGELAITIDDKCDVWAVLRFFNDDYLGPPITIK